LARSNFSYDKRKKELEKKKKKDEKQQRKQEKSRIRSGENSDQVQDDKNQELDK
jgi:hypothetical protein